MKFQEVQGKTIFWVCNVLLLVVSGLHATPVCPSSGTYATLQSFSAGCLIEGVVFSDFTLTDTQSDNGTAPAAGNIDYKTIITAGPNGQIGFMFNSFTLGALGAGTSSKATLKIGYSIDATGPQEDIIAGGLAMTLASLNTAGLNASISETFTPPGGASCTSAVTPKNPNTCTFTVPGSQPMDYIYFNQSSTPQGVPPGMVLKVAKTLTVTAKPGAGLASISAFSNVIDITNPVSVPEPGFYGILAGGLTGIFLFTKRHKKWCKSWRSVLSASQK